MSSLKKVGRVIETLSGFAGRLAAVSTIALMLIIVTAVIARYVFRAPIAYVEEISAYLAAWLILFGLAYCAQVGGHIRADFLIERLNGRVRYIMECLSIAIVAVWVILLTWGCCIVFIEWAATNRECTGFLTISLWIPAVPLAVGTVLLALQTLVQVAKVATSKTFGRGEEKTW